MNAANGWKHDEIRDVTAATLPANNIALSVRGSFRARKSDTDRKF
jgi:hypothetical protein